jgi:Na+-driven multidrug efflux pump
MLGLFVDNPNSIAFGTMYLTTVCFFYPFLGINFVLNGIIRGAGGMMQILILNFISFWVLRYPLTALFSEWTGEQGIAYGMGTSFIISALFAGAYYRFGRWREIRVLQRR